jgi:DNA-binding transcriptional LysR family regulator
MDNGTISLRALGGYPHVILSSTGEDTDFVDAHLARHDLSRRVTLRAPLLGAAATLAQSEMIAVLSESTARTFADLVPLDVLSLPFRSPQLTLAMMWHRRVDSVSDHQWLRGLIARIAGTASRP